MALRKRLNASWTSAAVQGLVFTGFAFDNGFAPASFGAALAVFLTVFLAPFVATFLGTAGTLDFFAPIERVILAMIGIY